MGPAYSLNLLVEFTSKVYELSLSARVTGYNYESSFPGQIGWSS